MSKHSSVKYYQYNKERLQKKHMKDIKAFLKKKKKKWQYGCEWYKNLPGYEKEKLIEYRKKVIIKWKKTLYYNHKNLFPFRKSTINFERV